MKTARKEGMRATRCNSSSAKSMFCSGNTAAPNNRCGAVGHRMPRARIQLADRVPIHSGSPQRMPRQIGVGRVAEDLAIDLQIRAGLAFLTPERMLSERAVLGVEIFLP